VEIDDAATYFYTGLQFASMEGLGDIVIGSGSQALNDFFLVGVAAEEDYVGIDLSEVAAYALAEFNTAKIRHGPVGDYQVWLVFGKQIHGLAAIGRK
jgi:hypothetical protein